MVVLRENRIIFHLAVVLQDAILNNVVIFVLKVKHLVKVAPIVVIVDGRSLLFRQGLENVLRVVHKKLLLHPKLELWVALKNTNELMLSDGKALHVRFSPINKVVPFVEANLKASDYS